MVEHIVVKSSIVEDSWGILHQRRRANTDPNFINTPNDYETELYKKFIYPARCAIIKAIESDEYEIGQTAYIGFIIRDGDNVNNELYGGDDCLWPRLSILCDTTKYKFDCSVEYHPATSGIRLTYSHVVTEEDKKRCLNRRQCVSSLCLLPFIRMPLKPESQYHLLTSSVYDPCSSIIYNDIIRLGQLHIIKAIEEEDAESYHLSFVLKAEYLEEYNLIGRDIKYLCDTDKYKFDCKITYDVKHKAPRVTYTYKRK